MWDNAGIGDYYGSLPDELADVFYEPESYQDDLIIVEEPH